MKQIGRTVTRELTRGLLGVLGLKVLNHTEKVCFKKLFKNMLFYLLRFNTFGL
jgi:hypothetical protein